MRKTALILQDTIDGLRPEYDELYGSSLVLQALVFSAICMFDTIAKNPNALKRSIAEFRLMLDNGFGMYPDEFLDRVLDPRDPNLTEVRKLAEKICTTVIKESMK